MSGHQVKRVWGQPERVTVSDSLFPEMCPETTICVWTYQNPYRLVVFRDGAVVRVAERAKSLGLYESTIERTDPLAKMN